jgi:hypothetical protein
MASAAAKDSKNLPFWAVAEEQALKHPLWKDFGTFQSGEILEDGLRFAHVHEQVRKSGYAGRPGRLLSWLTPSKN